MSAYYNEIDPEAIAVLHELMRLNLIAPGHIDSRSIKEVMPDDLKGFTQCHFFAGAGLWSVAARLAGFSDSRSLWTASCPCQPFSVAGKGAGIADERHLWPDMDRLIHGCREAGHGPSCLVGEQVAGKDGRYWFNGVRSDLAKQGYRSRVVDIPSCAVDAPNIRQRLYWVAVVNAAGERWGEGRAEPELRSGRAALAGPDAQGIDMGDAAGHGRQQGQPAAQAARHGDQPATAYGRNGSFWSDSRWIICHDEYARRIPWQSESGIRHVADGLPGRSDPGDPADGGQEEIPYQLLVKNMKGRAAAWKLAGNAINPVLAAEVIGVLLDCFQDEEVNTQMEKVA